MPAVTHCLGVHLSICILEVRIAAPFSIEPVAASLVHEFRIVGYVDGVAAVIGHASINEVRIGLRTVEVRLDGMRIAVAYELSDSRRLVDFSVNGILREDTEVPRITVLRRLNHNPAASQYAFWLNDRAVIISQCGFAIPYIGNGFTVPAFVVAVQGYYFVPIHNWHLVNDKRTEVIHCGNACCRCSVNASGVDGRALDRVLQRPLAFIAGINSSCLFLGNRASAYVLVNVGYDIGIYEHLMLRAPENVCHLRVGQRHHVTVVDVGDSRAVLNHELQTAAKDIAFTVVVSVSVIKIPE